MSQKSKAILALFICIVFWASAFVGIRFSIKDFSAGSLALFRYMVASVVIGYPFFKLKNKRLPSIKDFLYFLFLGVIGFSIYNVCLNEGEITVSAGISNFIICQSPIIVSIVAYFAFKEQLNKIGILGFILSLIGIILIMLGESEHHFDLGIVYVLAGTLSGAIYSIGQKVSLSRYRPVEVAAYAIWSGTLFMLIFLPTMIGDLAQSHWQADLSVIYMGIFPGAISYALWAYGFKYYPATKASSLLYLMPFITIFLAWVFLNEKPHIIAIVGGLVALLGSYMVNRTKIH